MQLIVEPESTLDIEINMSSVENKQNNKNDDLKIVNLDIDNHHDKKCNGNKQDSDLKEDSNCEKTKEVISKIHEALADIPINIDNNEAELSKVDLSEIINEKNYSHEIKDVQTEESQIEGSETDINGKDSIENETIDIDERKEALDEDYLEDDIISIVEEPFKEVSLPETEAEDVVLERSDNNRIKNTLAFGEDKFEVEDDKKEPLQFDRTSVINPDDIVEIEEEETDTNPEQCIKELQIPIEKDEDDNVMTESQGMFPIEGEQETPLTMQKGEDDLTVTEEMDSAVHNEIAILPVFNDNDTIEVIDESDSSQLKEAESVQTIADNEKIEVTPGEEHSIACDNSVESPTEEPKQDDIEIVEEIEKTAPVTEDGNDQINIVEETEEHSIQSNNIIDSEIDKATKNTGQITDTIDSTSNKNQDVEIIEELKEPFDRDENKTDSHREVKVTDNIMEPKENVNTEKTSETSKCESDGQILKTSTIDTPIDNHVMDIEEIAKDAAIATKSANSTIELNFDMDVEDEVEETTSNKKDDTDVNGSTPVTTTAVNIIDRPIICKLSNTLDILSDDDEEELPEVNFGMAEPPKVDLPEPSKDANNKCIDLEDDDDIMLIDEDTNKTETKSPADPNINKETVVHTDINTDLETGEKTIQETSDLFESHDKKETTPPPVANKDLNMAIDIKEKTPEPKIDKNEPPPPLIPDNFVKTAKKKLSDMTRDDLEEFCILKIVESIVDRSSLSDIKNKLKSMTQGLEEYRKKAMMLTKQNRDLQVVLKSVQEEQKKVMGNTPITPLKITRSVGMQVYMEKTVPRKKGPQQNINNRNQNNIQNKNVIPLGQGIRPQKQVNQSIPVPRLVPANNPAMKTPSTIPQINQMNATPGKNINPPNGMLKTPPPAMKAEKRQHNKVSPASSVTVDLTDDEPPAKMPAGPRTSPAPPVRLVPPQNLMGPQRQPFGTNVNSPRKVYIPISGPQNQALRPGQTIMLKTVPASGIRPRCPTPQVTRVDPNAVRMNRIAPRHPAPLPFAMKQYQPPNWKSLPPAPDLKLSKVENGIVISWKIEGVSEDSYEEIASYQLYAYQETSQPASTTLWKKIGDVKALPLPMACTLTQFMAGFKYYFAVRAVDIRSRLGPFSLPGSILLLSKNI